MVIHPDIVAYASRNHDYGTLIPEDQVRLNIIRLEIDRIRIEVQRRSLMYDGPPLNHRARCPICWNHFDPTVYIVSSACGHVLCNPCFVRQVEYSSTCSLCRLIVRGRDTTQLFMRFNYRTAIICRRCTNELDPESNVYQTTCGDVFCQNCTDRMMNAVNGGCYGCGMYLSARHLATRIYISYD